MNRRSFVGTLGLVLLAAPLAAEAQQAGKVWRVGFLGTTLPPLPMWEAFLGGLREHGYVEGQNLIIERRYAKIDRFSDLAVELVQLHVDVLVAPNPQAALAAKQATATIPIVLVVVGDPVGLGLVSSLARPGGNITGVTTWVPGGFFGKGLGLLKEVRPRASRVAILMNPSNATHQAIISNETQSVAQPLGSPSRHSRWRSPSSLTVPLTR